MADFFLSDVHLRVDRPERGERLARFMNALRPNDALMIVGDLCDFWMVAREFRDPFLCPGIRSIADFLNRGGSVTLQPGNHDAWASDFYRDRLGVGWIETAVRLNSHGLRLHVEHGHRLGGVSPWKAAMESRAFLETFRRVPRFAANRLSDRLDRSNEARRLRNDRKYLKLFGDFADRSTGAVDLIVLGHLHRALDDASRAPRLIVLGNWHARASYLRIDDAGAAFVVE